MTSPINGSVVLRHVPRGEGHPYESSPVERVPRDPVAGEPVALGVTTSPAGAVQSVTVLWSVNAGPERSAVAQKRSETESETLWQAILPEFSAGDRIRYRFVAEPGRERPETFEFVVAGWRKAGRVLKFRAGGPVLEVECEGGLRVAVWFEGDGAVRVRAEVGQEDRPAPRPAIPFEKASETKDWLTVEAQGLKVVIHRGPFRLEILNRDGEALFAEPVGGALGWLAQDREALQVSTQWGITPDESLFGFGERFNAFDQRGERLDAWVYEQYKNQGSRTYIPVPFFVSSRGYGVFVDTSRRTFFDLGAGLPAVASLAADGPVLDLVLYAGPPKEIVGRFAKRVGKAALPPKWAFGLWMSGNEWNNQAVVERQVELTEQHGIPATVLVVEAWSDESTFYIFNDARYTPREGKEAFRLSDFAFPADGLWPDPKGLVDNLHRHGMHLVLWQIPVLKRLDAPHAQHDADTAHALERGYMVHEADGRPYRIRPIWFRGGYVPDLTNPEAVEWWQAKRRYLVDELGVDGFKTDGGEHLWGEDIRFFDGRRGGEVINLFPNLYQTAYAELAGPDRVLFSRAGFTGTQRLSLHWAGDENSTFEAFRNSITAGLTAGVSGIPFWGWDIAGFSGEIPSAELYLRATAMAAFCPIMQYHSEFNEHRRPLHDRTPWNIAERTGDSKVIPTFRFFANLRMNLLPYIWSEAIKSSRTGLPMMRALPLEFPADRAVRKYPYQYLFGESLLVAPVAWEGSDRLEVYLPEGEWYDFWSGERHLGGRGIDCNVPMDRIPVFARAGSAVALNLDASLRLGSPVGNDVNRYDRLCFAVYPAGEPVKCVWHHNPKHAPAEFTIGPEGTDLPDLPMPARILHPGQFR